MSKYTLSKPVRAILDQALRMTPEERAVIIDGLHQSLFGPIDPDIEAAWIRVVESRLADYETGKVQAIPVEDLLKRLDERCR